MLLHLPLDVFQHIVDFVKHDSYAIVGTVCTSFRDCYTQSQKITRFSKYTQSPQLLERSPRLKLNDPGLLDNLISRNEISSIPLLLSRGLEWDHFCVERAAEVNNKHFFDWLITTELVWLPENAHRAAAESGNLNIMMYLVDSGAGYPDNRSLLAAHRQNWGEIVGWLRELQLDGEYEMVQAARENNVYAFEQTETFDNHHQNQMYITEACANASFDVLEFFRQYVGVGPTVQDVKMATQFQRFRVVEWCAEFFPDVV